MNLLVEGPTDAVVVRRILDLVGLAPDRIVLHSKQALLRRVRGYNEAARFVPWLCVVDLNGDARCPPHFVRDHLPDRSPLMLFRVSVRSIESWLLADAARCASFLRVSPELVPQDPEHLVSPKLTMVGLARRSRDRYVVADMVPRTGSGATEGPAYASRLQDFVRSRSEGWRPEVAAQHAPSLARCLTALRSHVQRLEAG